MRRRIPSTFFPALALAAAAPEAAPFVDMAGRPPPVPLPAKGVYSTSPVGEIFVYTLAPDRVKGVCWTLRAREIPWLLPAYTKLPVLGGWFGKSGSANMEEIAKVAPDLIISAGMADAQAATTADKLQATTGIPVAVFDETLTKIDTTWRLLGKLLGRQARADTLAREARRILTETLQRREARKGDRPWRVYYAQGIKGLETDPSGSPHTELLDWLGIHNVAEVPLLKGYGRARVSLEQLLVWDPDWILVNQDHTDGPSTLLSQLEKDPLWKELRAVREGRIVRIPDYPFNWFDRPPGPQRLLGLLWLETLLYPAQSPRTAFQTEIRRLYPLFYHRKLSATDEKALFANAFHR